MCPTLSSDDTRNTCFATAYQAFTVSLLTSIWAGACADAGEPRGRPRIQTFREGKNQVLVTLLADDVVRLRVGPGGDFANDRNPEYSIIKPDTKWAGAEDTDPSPDVVNTGKLKLVFTHNPLAVTITDAAGKPLVQAYVFDFKSRQPKAVWALHHDEAIYGFGDARSDMNKRGIEQQVINTDSDAHWEDRNATYKSIPMYWSSRGYGVYLHNWWPSVFNMGQADPARTQIRASGGELDFYIFYGPTFHNIVGRYTELTGRPALLPKWAYGYHQGAAALEESQLATWADDVAKGMRENQLPIDVVFFDDWKSAPFNTDDPDENKKFVDAMLNENHLRISAGLGMPYEEVGSNLWQKLDGMDGLVNGPDGVALEYEANGFGEDHPVTDIDWFNPAAVDAVFEDLWQGPLAAGVWSGMSDFGELDQIPSPNGARFPSFSQRSATELRNVYGLVYTEQLANRAAEFKHSRKIGMNRSGTAGSQRYGWTWTADSKPDWSDDNGFRGHLRAMLNLTMSGFSNVGYDIGGWDNGPSGRVTDIASDELYIRWFQAGMFNPYASAHGMGAHTIYTRPAEVIQACRTALNLRYRLLPYTYNLGFQASQTGVPMVRTMAFETNAEFDERDPNNAKTNTRNMDDQFFYGPDMLVAPIVEPGAKSRDVYLPKGASWTELATGAVFPGGGSITIQGQSIVNTPVFIKEGAVIPMQPVVQFVSAPPPLLLLEMFPGRTPSDFTLFEDDDHYGYENGVYRLTTMTPVKNADGSFTVTIAKPQLFGGLTPPQRTYQIVIHGCAGVGYQVRINGTPSPNTVNYDANAKTCRVDVTDDGQMKTVIFIPLSK